MGESPAVLHLGLRDHALRVYWRVVLVRIKVCVGGASLDSSVIGAMGETIRHTPFPCRGLRWV
jgi:hypothetical protein